MTDIEPTTEQPSRKRRKPQTPPATVVEQPIEQAPVDLPTIEQLETTLRAGGFDLDTLAVAHESIQTYQCLIGSRDGGAAMFSSLFGAETPEALCEEYAASLGAWFVLRDAAYFDSVSRAAELLAAESTNAA